MVALLILRAEAISDTFWLFSMTIWYAISFLSLAWIVGLPPNLPRPRAEDSPTYVRSLMSSFSSSAKALIIWKKNRPLAVVVSIVSVNDLNWMLFFSKSSISSTNCLTVRPKRSNLTTINISFQFDLLNFDHQ